MSQLQDYLNAGNTLQDWISATDRSFWAHFKNAAYELSDLADNLASGEINVSEIVIWLERVNVALDGMGNEFNDLSHAAKHLSADNTKISRSIGASSPSISTSIAQDARDALTAGRDINIMLGRGRFVWVPDEETDI